MLTFLRCGVYRLVHGRKFWIGTALASVLCFAVMALMFVTMGMVDVDGTVSTGTVHLTVGGERYAGVEMDADDAALLGMFADRTFVTMGMVDVDGTVSTGTVHLTVGGERYAGVEMDADDAALLGMFADRTVPNHSFLLVFMGFFQGGMAGLLVSIIATLAYAEDHEHGFVKAELAGRAGRIGYYASHLVLAALLAAWYSLVVIASTELAFAVFGIRVADSEPGRAGRIGYYASHLVLAALLAAWYSLVVIASTELAFAVFGIRVADSEPFGQYWRLAGLNILGIVAVTFIVTALHTIVRSKVAGVIIAVFVASGRSS